METYTPGHSEAVACGCGPGSITVGIAARVAPGEVVGIDFAPDQVARARHADAQRALRELYRVLAPGGVIGLCSPDWGGFLLSPASLAASRALDAYMALQSGNGGDVRAGRNQGVQLAAAGFEAIELSARYECYDSRELIAEYLARRLEQAGDVASAFALRDWSKEKPGMFAQAWVSAVARKPGEAGYDPATPTGGDDGNSKLGA